MYILEKYYQGQLLKNINFNFFQQFSIFFLVSKIEFSYGKYQQVL